MFSFFRSGSNNNNKRTSSLKLTFETQKTGELDSLNNFIKDFKYDKMVFTDYDSYSKNLNDIMSNQSQNKLYQTELDYLYKAKLKSLNKEPKPNESNVNKMKEAGKIFGANKTFFDPTAAGQNVVLLSNNLKIESLNSFVSIMANNCVFSGKWCYEVTLLTNGLMQIGFCQVITQFTRHAGVGDDITSYGFDGYRKCKWNGEKKEFGKIWDVGDVLGVCIDMDNKIIEYFLNGEYIGTAFNNIPKGENVAFFPGVSLSRGESCLFNFGQLPFKYSYKNYKSFDIPMSKVNGTDQIVSNLLKFWKNNILPLLSSKKISNYQDLLLSSDIFNFVSQNITDPFIFNEVIIPFLLDIMNNEKEKKFCIDKFITSILNLITDHEVQKNVGFFIFEQLSVSILEKGLRMGHHIKGNINNDLYLKKKTK
jgi:hypothetical protein